MEVLLGPLNFYADANDSVVCSQSHQKSF
jgi:hypothetical protein